MGMNEAAVGADNSQMKLAGPHTQQQDIASLLVTGSEYEASAQGCPGKPLDRTHLQRVIEGKANWPARSIQGSFDQPHAIEALMRIPAMQPERRAQQRFCRLRHDAPGHWARP
jgi:hypothetical protein